MWNSHSAWLSMSINWVRYPRFPFIHSSFSLPPYSILRLFRFHRYSFSLSLSFFLLSLCLFFSLTLLFLCFSLSPVSMFCSPPSLHVHCYVSIRSHSMLWSWLSLLLFFLIFIPHDLLSLLNHTSQTQTENLFVGFSLLNCYFQTNTVLSLTCGFMGFKLQWYGIINYFFE